MLTVALFGKRAFAAVIKRRMRWNHPRLYGWGLYPMVSVLMWENCRWHREEGHVKRGQGLQGGRPAMPGTATGRKRRERSSPLVFRGSVDLLIPWFWNLTSRAVREWVFVILSHQICGDVLQQPQDAHTLSLVMLILIAKLFSVTHGLALMSTASCFTKVLGSPSVIITPICR